MPAYVALLRAVNVGGTGKLPMPILKAMADDLGWAHARTFIASGNLVFSAAADEAAVKAALEAKLAAYADRPVGVLVRTADEMAAVLAANPFADAPANNVVAIFLDRAPPADAAATARHRVDEEIAPGKRELYVRYGAAGIGRSRLVIPAGKEGTARNMNTVAKLTELALALGSGPEKE